MTDALHITTQVGLKYVRVALRDTDGAIDVPAGQAVTTAYRGLQISGANALTVTVPEPNRVIATGDDRVYHTFLLPSDEPLGGELRTTKIDMDVIAMLTGVNVFGDSPTMRMVGINTDQAGSEPALIMWGSSQAVDSDPEGNKATAWVTYIFLNATATPMPSSKERATVGESRYTVVANDSAYDMFGQAFTILTHGFEQGPFVIIATSGRFGMCAWAADGNATVFNLPASELPLLRNPIVYDDGVQVESGLTFDLTAGTVTFGEAPSGKITAIYEY